MLFIGSIVAQVYKLFHETLDQDEPGVFTDFTFLVVDNEYLEELPDSEISPPAILVSSDPPDFNKWEKEDSTLKKLRTPLAEALVDVIAI